MSTRSQKRGNNQQESSEIVSETVSSPIFVENVDPKDQDVVLAGPSKGKSPRVEKSVLESLRASLKEEIAFEIKSSLLEFQRELLKLLKPETNGNIREQEENSLRVESRYFYTPTRCVRINSSQNNDLSTSRNTSIYIETLFVLVFK